MKVKVTQIRGVSGRTQRQRDTLQCLGLGRIGKSSDHKVNDAVLGMMKSVKHLIRVEEIK
jgi:large subunit ribosomal protein L30